MSNASSIFDDQGEVHETPGPSLRRSLPAPVGGSSLISYVVRNMGYIAVTRKQDSALVRLNPALVSATALIRFYYWLDEHRPQRVVLLIDNSSMPEVVGGASAAIKRINDLMAAHHLAADKVFLTRDRRVEDMSDVAALSQVLRFWRDSEAFSFDAFATLAAKIVDSRFILVRPENDAVVVAKIGRGLSIFGAGWLSVAEGLQFRDLPDSIYGRHAAKGYLKAAVGNQPILQDVDAIMHAPSVGYIRRRYTRLLLPIRDQVRNSSVLCASIRNYRIDLRVEAGHERL